MMVGVSSLGTAQHLSAELFRRQAKLEYTIVPFKTAPALTAALMAGDVTAGFELFPAMKGALQGGQARALAIGSARRSDLLPDVPTGAELGVAGFEVTSWGMIAAPAQTPDAVVQRLNREMQVVLTQPEVMQRLKDLGQRAHLGSPAQARDAMVREVARWSQVITNAGIAFR
jgi:tripartite-type tricarboxylate transporter receptor subunit TctC